MSEAPYVVPDTCPACGHSPVTEVVYGLVRRISPALQAELDSGRKVLGGCVISAEAPAYGCRACGWTCSQEDAHHPLAMIRRKMEEELGETP